MKFLNRDEASHLSLTEAREKAVFYAQGLQQSAHHIQALEKAVADLTKALAEAKQEKLFTQEVLDYLRTQTFGKSSERRTRDADSVGPLFECAQSEEPLVEPEEENNGSDATDSQADSSDDATQKKKKLPIRGRTPQPQLARVAVTHELPPDEIQARGLQVWDGQFEVSEVINVIPTRFVVEEHKRQKYLKPAALEGEAPIITAPGPLKLKDGSRYSIDFAVEIGISKYSFHLPLDRQVRLFASFGLEITSQVLYSQIDTVAWYLKPALLPEFKKVIESESVNIGDETWWWNLEKDTADKKDRFYLWGVRNKKAALFEIHDSRAQKVAKTFLGKLQGILVVDGYAGYNILESETLQLARCWFHLRRRFKAAEKNFPELADFFLNLIKKLCLIEREILLLTPEERLKLRQEKSKPVIDEIQARLQELDGAVLPRSSIGKAVSYGIKFWKGLTLFLEHPGVPIGTNDIELSLRHPVVGRKNHYGSKNLKTAETAAIWYSVIETCRIHQVDPRKYITQALKNILSKKPVLMPWDFKASS